MDVRIEHGQHRLVGNFGNTRQHHLTDLDATARIHYDDAVVADDEGRVVHEALVPRIRQFSRAMNDVDPGGDLVRRPSVRQRRALRDGVDCTHEQQPHRDNHCLSHGTLLESASAAGPDSQAQRV